MSNKSLYIFVLIVGLFIVSCSGYQRILNGNDIDLKASTGVDYYKKSNYFKALPLLESVVPLYRGTKKGEDLYYYYAKSNYELGDYYSSSYHFKTFYDFYPTSIYAKEALFYSGYSSYLLSPEYALDQEDSYQAIDNLQTFVNTYPNDKLVDSCNAIIDILFKKFKQKDLENSKNYFNTEKYQAALVTMNNYIERYADDSEIDLLRLYSLEAHFRLYKNSVESKKEKRFKTCLNYYATFKRLVSDKKMQEKAEKIIKKTYLEYDSYTKRKKRKERFNKMINYIY